MEWKQDAVGYIPEYYEPLETSLVEWKHSLLLGTEDGNGPLETSLVEWKHAWSREGVSFALPWKLP